MTKKGFVTELFIDTKKNDLGSEDCNTAPEHICTHWELSLSPSQGAQARSESPSAALGHHDASL